MTDHEESSQLLFKQIQMLCSGEEADVVLTALQDSLSAVVGFMAVNNRDADGLIEETVQQLRASVELNWDATREMRAQCTQISKTHQ